MNKSIAFVSVLLTISCAGRAPEGSNGTVILQCPDVVEAPQPDVTVTCPEQDDTALVSCLGDLDEALDLCEVDDVEPEPAAEHVLTVTFTTAFHAAEPFEVLPGASEVILGTILLRSMDESPIVIDEQRLTLLVADNVGLNYQPGISGDVRVDESVDACRLVRWPGGTSYSDEIAPQGDGTLRFWEDLTVVGEDALALDVVCDFAPVLPHNNDADGFAVDILSAA